MTLHQLKILAAVAKYRNITKASKELRIAQSSASEQMKFLEAEYEVQLYRKAGLGIELTEAGQSFLREAKAIIAEVESLKEKFSSYGTKAASLRVGGSHSPSASFLPLLAAVFKETHPHVELTLRAATSAGIARLLLNSEIEIGLITNPPRDPSIAVEPYRHEKLVAFVSAKHPLARKEKLSVAELAASPLVIKKGGEGEDRVAQILRELEKQGYELNIFMYCQSPESTKAAVKTGVGLGILYQKLVEPEAKRGELKILKVRELKMKVETSIIYHKERPLSPDAQDFFVLLREWPKKSKLGVSLSAVTSPQVSTGRIIR